MANQTRPVAVFHSSSGVLLEHYVNGAGSNAMSALPDAPVVAYIPRVSHLRRTRRRTAYALHALAHQLEPVTIAG